MITGGAIGLSSKTTLDGTFCFIHMPKKTITRTDEAGNVCTSDTDREDIQLLVCIMTKPTNIILISNPEKGLV